MKRLCSFPHLIIFLLFFFGHSLFAQEVKVKFGGFIQTTAIKSEDNDGFKFGFDRVRVIASGSLNEYTDFKLQVDFNKQSTHLDKDGDTPGIIKDALVIFKPTEKLRVSVGKFKTPIGMEFNGSGKKLDFVKRGLGQVLVFERNAGAMVYGQGLGDLGLGFAAGVFNAGPSKATGVGNAKDGDYTLAARLSVMPVKDIHAEVFGGTATSSVDSIEGVTMFGGAVKAKLGQATIKGEFMSRTDDNNTSADGTDFYVQGGYKISPNIEPILKYEKLDVKKDAKDQVNITAGLNFFINADKVHQSKIQVNYVSSDLDGKSGIQIMFQAIF